MADLRTLVRDEMERAGSPSYSFNDLGRRRDRKRRNERIAAGVVGIMVFVAAVWIVTTVGSSDRTQTPAVPGEGAETGPAVTNREPPKEAPIGPVPETDYLLDLNTGETTPLPESIVGTANDRTGEYTVSPDGSRLAYAGPGDNGSRQIFVANLDGTGAQQVTNDRGPEAGAWPDLPLGHPTWSSDGSMIAYIGSRGDDSGNVFVLDLATGSSTQLTFYTFPWSVSSPPSFSPDGSSIVYSVNEIVWGEAAGEILIVPIAGGESVRLVGGIGVNDGQLSPDGSLLSYACNRRSRCLANADGTDAKVIVQGNDWSPGVPATDFVWSARWSPDGTRIVYWEFHTYDVLVMDVATGEVTHVAEGASPVWLDDHTLIVEINRCYNHKRGGIIQTCPG